MEQKDALIVPPSSLEGIAIHIGYLRRDISDISGKMDEIKDNYVSKSDIKVISDEVASLKTFRDNYDGAEKQMRRNSMLMGAGAGGGITALFQLLQWIINHFHS